MRARISDIGQTVGKFEKRRIRSGANTVIILIVGSFGTRATLLVGQSIHHLGGHKSLLIAHPPPGSAHHIVISEASILDAVVIESTEKQRHNVALIYAYSIAKAMHPISHHIEMIAIR